MNKITKIIISLSIIPIIIIFIAYGNQKICTKDNETLVDGYCERDETIYLREKPQCPIGYTFSTYNHKCEEQILSAYRHSIDYICPAGYYKNENRYHAHLPFTYQCCYKIITKRKEAKSRFYYWFN